MDNVWQVHTSYVCTIDLQFHPSWLCAHECFECILPLVNLKPSVKQEKAHPQSVGEDRGGDKLVLGHFTQQLIVVSLIKKDLVYNLLLLLSLAPLLHLHIHPYQLPSAAPIPYYTCTDFVLKFNVRHRGLETVRRFQQSGKQPRRLGGDSCATVQTFTSSR